MGEARRTRKGWLQMLRSSMTLLETLLAFGCWAPSLPCSPCMTSPDRCFWYSEAGHRIVLSTCMITDEYVATSCCPQALCPVVVQPIHVHVCSYHITNVCSMADSWTLFCLVQQHFPSLHLYHFT